MTKTIKETVTECRTTFSYTEVAQALDAYVMEQHNRLPGSPRLSLIVDVGADEITLVQRHAKTEVLPDVA